MAYRVVDDGEILLDDIRYKLYESGPLRVVSIRQLPEKMVQGDSTRADQRLASEWVISDTTGGLGINESDDAAMDRFTWATMNTDAKGSITNNIEPSEVKTAVSTAALNVQLVGVFQDTPLIAGTPITTGGALDIYTYNETDLDLDSLGFAVSMSTATSTITDIVEYGPYAFIANGDRFFMYNSTSSRTSLTTEVATGSVIRRNNALSTYQGAKYFCASGNELYKFSEGTTDNYIQQLDTSKTLASDSDLWVDVVSMAKHYNVTGMTTFIDNQNNSAVYIVTTEGCLILGSNNDLYATPLQFTPSLRNGQRGMAYDGLFWYPENLSVHRYIPGSVQNIGLDRDDGLPIDYRGYIKDLCPTPYHVYAIVEQQFLSSSYNAALGTVFTDISSDEGQVLGISSNKGTLYYYNTTGWHVRHVGDSDATFVNCRYTLVLDKVPTLWLGTSKGLLKFGLPSGTRKLTEDPDIVYSTNNTFKSVDYTAGFAEIKKNASVLKIRARGIVAGNTVQVSYSLNGSNSEIVLGTINSTNYVVGDYDVGAGSGSWELRFNSNDGTSSENGGVAFKSIRIHLATSQTVSITPIEIKFMVLRFERILPALLSYSARLDLSHAYKGRSVAELIDQLELTAEKTATVPFAWRSAGEPRERWVRVTQLQAQTTTGVSLEGIYEVVLSEITNYSESA